MPDPLDPQALSDTETMDGVLTSCACEHVGTPSVIIWIQEDGTGTVHQMNDRLETDAVATMGILQLARDAVIHNRSVRVRWTESNGSKYFHLLRVY